MELTILAAAAAAVLAAAATYAAMRSQGARQLAEARGAWAGELAAVKQDNKWLAQEAERERQALTSTKDVLDKAERQLRDAFQGLAAEALRANQGAFLDLAKATFDGLKNETAAQMDARHKAIDTLVKPLAESLKAVEVRLGETERTDRKSTRLNSS